MSTLAVPEIVKQYRLLYRNDDGVAAYSCVDAEGTSLMMLCPGKLPFSSMVVGFCLECLLAHAEGAEHCDRPVCPRDSSVELASPVTELAPDDRVSEPVTAPVSAPVQELVPDIRRPASVSPITADSALQLARTVWGWGQVDRANHFRGINPQSSEKWIAHAIDMQWVIADGDLIKKGPVDPTPPDLSCIGLVTTLSKVVEDGLGVVGDAWWRGDLLVAEADGGGPQRS
jgi:hypothetical protein